MSGVTVVLPSIVPEFTRACIETMRFVDPAQVPDPSHEHRHASDIVEVNGNVWTDGQPDVRLVVVYNTVEDNHGVAGSWNIGIRAMYEHGHDWLVICSAGIRFGETGGRDFLDRWVLAPYGPLGRTDEQTRPSIVEADGGLGWHLIAFHRSVFQKVGYFDENYHPAYFEDLDWSVRIQLAYGIDSRAPGWVGPLWPKVPTDATLAETAHGIKRSGVICDLEAMERYHTIKWGGRGQHERFTTPYNSGNPVSYWRGPSMAGR